MTEKLLVVFGGTTIRVPSSKELRDMEQELLIYSSISRLSGRRERSKAASVLSSHLGISKRRVYETYRRVRRVVRRHQKALKEDTRSRKRFRKRRK